MMGEPTPPCQCEPGAWPDRDAAPPACTAFRGDYNNCDNCGHETACHAHTRAMPELAQGPAGFCEVCARPCWVDVTFHEPWCAAIKALRERVTHLEDHLAKGTDLLPIDPVTAATYHQVVGEGLRDLAREHVEQGTEPDDAIIRLQRLSARHYKRARELQGSD